MARHRVEVRGRRSGLKDLAQSAELQTQQSSRTLEHDSVWRNRQRGFPKVVVSDSRCWLGWGPASNGETLFTGFAGAGCGVGVGRAFVSRDGGDLRGERGLCGEVVSALSGERQRGGLPDGGHRPRSLTGERAWLLARIAEKPDLTLRAVVAELAARGTPTSYGAVWRFYAREGITFKKSLHASEQDRPDVARRRARWKRYQGRLDPRRLVFICNSSNLT